MRGHIAVERVLGFTLPEAATWILIGSCLFFRNSSPSPQVEGIQSIAAFTRPVLSPVMFRAPTSHRGCARRSALMTPKRSLHLYGRLCKRILEWDSTRSCLDSNGRVMQDKHFASVWTPTYLQKPTKPMWIFCWQGTSHTHSAKWWLGAVAYVTPNKRTCVLRAIITPNEERKSYGGSVGSICCKLVRDQWLILCGNASRRYKFSRL